MGGIMKKVMFSVLSLIFFVSTLAHAHCQIPCGIYDDKARLEAIKEHIDTIEKSITSIIELSQEKDINYNQLIRWVNNKDAHAGYIQDIVSEYFLAQRITPFGVEDAEAHMKYINELTLLHKMIIYAMKAKQTTDLSVVETMRGILKDFSLLYAGK